jgi:hypothetical protein
MRNRMRFVGVVSLAIVGAFAMMSIAWADNATQTLEGTITPSKLPKKNFKGASINVEVSTDTEPPGGVLDPADRATIDFDNSIKFTTKKMKQCKKDLAGTTTAEALDLCKKAKVGTGSGFARLGVTNLPAVVTAFNAPNNTILLHSRVEAAATTAVLSGKLKKSNNGSADYGKQLDVTIPPLPGGAAVSQFEVTVKKKFTYKKRGKKITKHYVSAKCDDGNKTLNYAGEFFFEDGDEGPYTLSATAEQACTRR